MAEIDFRIPLGIRPVQTQSIAPTLLALGQLQRGQQRGRLNEQLLAKGEQEAAQAAQIQQALAALGQGQGNQQPGDAGAIDVPFQGVSVPQGQAPQELPGGTIGPQALAPGLQPQQQALAAPGQPPASQGGGLPPTELVIARAAIRTRLGDPEGGAKELANHKASLDLQKQEIDLVETKMKAAGNIAAVVTSQESLERNRPRLQEIACSIWPNCKVPAIFNTVEFDELKRLGQDSAEEVADARVIIDQEFAKLAGAKEARLTREGAGISGPVAQERFKRANVLRDDFTRQSTSFRVAQDGMNVIRGAVEGTPTPAGDLALVFGFMKALDPTSVVREGEQATLRKTGSLGEQFRNRLIQLSEGLIFGTPAANSLRQEIVDRAETIQARRRKQQDQLEKTFTGLATRAKVDPRNVLTGTTLAPRGDRRAIQTPTAVPFTAAQEAEMLRRGLTQAQIDKANPGRARGQ